MEAEQLGLFDNVVALHAVEEVDGRGLSHEERFWLFHRANPHVYEALRESALRLKRGGWEHYGIARLVEGLRYQRSFQTTSDDYKINNNHRAFYARLLMEREPALAGFFETREQKAG